MGKKLLVLVSFFVISLSPALAYAQDASTATTPETSTTSVASNQTDSTTNTKLGLRKTLAAPAATKTDIKDQMLQAREEFKLKLAAIKDQKKQTVVTNLDSRIAAINKKRTTEMSERLDRLSTILGKISTKEAALKSQGKNTATLQADIVAAQAAIDAAKQAVTDQAAKVYVINITTEAGLKGAVSTTIRQFMADLKAVHAKVVAAQLAVVKSNKDVGLLMGLTPSPSATVTAAPTAQP